MSGETDSVLVGVAPCGCFTAVMVEYADIPASEMADFYATMADTGREVRRMTLDEARANPTFLNCEHQGAQE